jgi:hypothetical protein
LKTRQYSGGSGKHAAFITPLAVRATTSTLVAKQIGPTLKKTFVLLACILLLGPLLHSASCFDHTDDTVDFHGPDVRPGYPDQFHLHFVFPKNTLSPNGKYGVIFPDRTLGETENDSLHNFVVLLEPSQILTELATESPEFEGKSHGGYEVEWTADSSVMLITLEAKWGPGEFFLVELQDGKVSRTTNLDQKIRQLIKPEYLKTHAKADNQSYDFIYEYQESEAGFCKLESPTRVKVDAYFTDDPKGDNPWRARLRATWDIPGAKFAQQRVTRLSSRSE